MIPFFDYLVFRVFEDLDNKKNEDAKDYSINFIVLTQATLVIPLSLFFRLFIEFDPQILGNDKRIKYYIGIPLATVLYLINGTIYKRKLNGEGLENMRKRYHKEKYKIPIWVIYAIPLIVILVFPILYGLINGTLRFPLLEK